MIRRRVGETFLLIPQHEHALLSGRIAQHYGNALFAPPQPRQETLRAVALHDCGWPLHDDAPRLNRAGLPLDVFENHLPLSLQMWSEASQRIEHEAPYTRLLVSLHGLHLSSFAAANPHTPQEIFQLNKFQHQEIERQVNLRRELGLATDIPVRLGLALTDEIEAENRLKHNYGLVRIMDVLSLGLCCTELLFPQIDNVLPRPEARPLTLKLRRTSPTSLRIDPWPFDQPSLSFAVPGRVVPARKYSSEEEFQQVHAAAPVQRLAVTVHGE